MRTRTLAGSMALIAFVCACSENPFESQLRVSADCDPTTEDQDESSVSLNVGDSVELTSRYDPSTDPCGFVWTADPQSAVNISGSTAVEEDGECVGTATVMVLSAGSISVRGKPDVETTNVALGDNLCTLSVAGGDEIVLDQPRNDDWDYFSDASCDPVSGGCSATNVVAENFLVPSTGASITEIVIWGGWWPTGTRTSDDWTVIIHADAAGLPGAAVYTQANFAASSIQNIGEIFGVGYYEVTLELTGDVDLSPGTHWIEIFHDSGSGEDWFWVTGNQDDVNGLPGFAEAPEAPGVNWSAHDVDSEPPLRRSLAIRVSG